MLGIIDPVTENKRSNIIKTLSNVSFKLMKPHTYTSHTYASLYSALDKTILIIIYFDILYILYTKLSLSVNACIAYKEQINKQLLENAHNHSKYTIEEE